MIEGSLEGAESVDIGTLWGTGGPRERGFRAVRAAAAGNLADAG